MDKAGFLVQYRVSFIRVMWQKRAFGPQNTGGYFPPHELPESGTLAILVCRERTYWPWVSFGWLCLANNEWVSQGVV